MKRVYNRRRAICSPATLRMHELVLPEATAKCSLHTPEELALNSDYCCRIRHFGWAAVVGIRVDPFRAVIPSLLRGQLRTPFPFF